MTKPVALMLAIAFGVLAAGPARADQTDARLGPLFAELKKTADPEVGSKLTEEIWGIWLETSDPEARARLKRGGEEMDEEDFDAALGDFNKVVEIAPKFAEGWNRRATLLYLMGDFDGSVRDIEKTLALEPRHFGALSGLGLIYLQLEKDEAALKAFTQALEINPFLAGAQHNIVEIKKRLKDRGI
jgi:tetratricopeptide (TPR) repeat protein